MTMDDTRLIARALKDDASAQQALYEAHFGRAYRLAYVFLQNAGDAEEIVQDAYVYVFAHLEQYDPDRGSFWAWLRVTLVSRCRNRRRRKEMAAVSLEALAAGGELRDPGGERDPAAAVAMRDSRRAILEALDLVSPGARDVLILRYYEGLKYAEIGEVLGCSAEAARSRAVHGKVQLREILTASLEAPVRARPAKRMTGARER